MRIAIGAGAALLSALVVVGQETPKTHEVERVFDAGFAKIELLGVCRATETEAQCWGPDGAPAPDMEQEFKAAFLVGDYVNFPTIYGRKSRVVVVRITNQMDNRQGMIDSSFGGTRGSFNWPNRSSYGDNTQRTQITAAVLVNKLTESIGSFSATLRRNAEPSARIPVREGANFEYLGTKFTIRKIVETKFDLPAYTVYGASRWVIKLTAEGPRSSRPGMNWVPLDTDGLVIRVVDKDGKPVIADPNAVQAQQYSQNPPPTRQTLMIARFSGGTSGTAAEGDDYSLYTNIDPKRIKEVFAAGSSTERIVFNGIPLEPKRS